MKRIGAFLAALTAFLTLATAQVKAADPSLSPEANAAYLASNSAKPGVVVRPSGLQYSIIKNGFGKRPLPTDTVTVSYTGMLINGKVFDGTEPMTPAQFTVNKLIPGLDRSAWPHAGGRQVAPRDPVRSGLWRTRRRGWNDPAQSNAGLRYGTAVHKACGKGTAGPGR